MSNPNIKTVSLLALSISLVACGGNGSGNNASGNGGPGVVGPGGVPEESKQTISYEKWDSQASKSSGLASAAIASNESNATYSLVSQSGSIQHGATPSIAVANGAKLEILPDIFGTYDYMRYHSQSYEDGGDKYTAQGVIGIVTSSDHLPETNPNGAPVTFSGESIANLVLGNSSHVMSGQSSVTVDFDREKIDVKMDEFVQIESSGQASSTLPFDRIKIDNAKINGNQFGGGRFATTLDGDIVHLTGADATSEMRGHFFGYDSAKSAPAEVGGVFLQQGDEGSFLTGGFAAKWTETSR